MSVGQGDVLQEGEVFGLEVVPLGGWGGGRRTSPVQVHGVIGREVDLSGYGWEEKAFGSSLICQPVSWGLFRRLRG